MAKTIRLTFSTDANRRVSISVPEPKNSLTSSGVKSIMDSIIATDIIKPNGASLVAAYRALIVENNTTTIYDSTSS